jgi:hypothetical protein
MFRQRNRRVVLYRTGSHCEGLKPGRYIKVAQPETGHCHGRARPQHTAVETADCNFTTLPAKSERALADGHSWSMTSATIPAVNAKYDPASAKMRCFDASCESWVIGPSLVLSRAINYTLLHRQRTEVQSCRLGIRQPFGTQPV